jgi:hypothetical protein
MACGHAASRNDGKDNGGDHADRIGQPAIGGGHTRHCFTVGRAHDHAPFPEKLVDTRESAPDRRSIALV